MITYLHKCDSCEHEWEAEYSIKDSPPKFCPKCNAETVRRLINSEGYSKMELTPEEFKERLKDETNKVKSLASKNENYLANLVGENKYNSNVQTKETIKRDFGKMFRRSK
jgi:putative FmdB family regulatory protein